MIVPLLEEEKIFIDYLDDDSLDWGLTLIEDAPQEAKDALDNYLNRYNKLKQNQKVEQS